MLKQLRAAIVSLTILTIVTGVPIRFSLRLSRTCCFPDRRREA